MIKLGILGTDTSHCITFTQLFHETSGKVSQRVEGAKVVALCPTEKERAKQLVEEFGVSEVCESGEEMIPKIDAVMVLSREGSEHLEHATPFLKAGMPTFVDKPLANSLSEARKIVRLAKRYKALLMSTSALRYAVELDYLRSKIEDLGEIRAGVVTGPGEIFFYGVHAIELMHCFFGPGVQYVTNVGSKNRDVATIHYQDGKTISAFILRDSVRLWQLVVYGSTGWDEIVVRDYTGFFREMLKDFVKMVETGEERFPTEYTLEAIGILTAIEQARRTKEKVYLSRL